MNLRSRLFIILTLAFCTLGIGEVSAQSKTIVLVRHVEKDISATAHKTDPELSAEGVARAQRLMRIARKYRPREIYSSNYKRTRLTAEPLAKRRKIEIQTYDPGKPNDLVEKIAASKNKRFMVVGHSNTIPALVNLIAKKEVFRQLLESEYGVIWVIRMKKGVVRKIEVFSY